MPPTHPIDSTLSTRVERITPAQAKKYLLKNVHNRPLTPSLVSRYAGVMKDGRWNLSHEGIAFGQDDNLCDGQHRLAAIVEANVPVNLLVTRGLSPKAREAIDTGRRRTSLDNLAIIAGVLLPKTIGAALNVIWMTTNTGTVMRSASAGELQETLRVHLQGVELVREVFTSTRRGICRSSFLAGFIFAYPTNPKKVRAMAEQFYSGENLSSGDPMYALREHALNSRTPGNRPDVILDFRKTLGMIAASLDGEKRSKVFAKPAASIEESKIFTRFAQVHKDS